MNPLWLFIGVILSFILMAIVGTRIDNAKETARQACKRAGGEMIIVGTVDGRTTGCAKVQFIEP